MESKSNIGKGPVGEGTEGTENRGSSLQLNPNLAKLREGWRQREGELPLVLRRGVPANPEQSTSSPAGHVEPIREDPRVTQHETSMNIQGEGLPLRRRPAGPVQVDLQDSGSTEAPGVGKVDTAYYEGFLLPNASIHDAYTKLLGSPGLDDSLRGKISKFAEQIKDLDVQYSVSYLFTKFDPRNNDQVLRLAVYSGPAAELVRNMTDIDSLSRFRDDVERALNTVNKGISASQTGIDSRRVLEFARGSFNNLLGKVDERLRYLSPTHGDGVPDRELPNAMTTDRDGGIVDSVTDNRKTAGGPTESIFDSQNTSVSSVYGEQQGDLMTETDDNQQTSHGDRGVVQAGPVETAGVGSVEFTGAEPAEPTSVEPVEPTDTEPAEPADTEPVDMESVEPTNTGSVGTTNVESVEPTNAEPVESTGTESVEPIDDTYPEESTGEVADDSETLVQQLKGEFLSDYSLLRGYLQELSNLQEIQQGYLEMIRGMIGGYGESLAGLRTRLETATNDLSDGADVLSSQLEQAPGKVRSLVYQLLGHQFFELSALANALSTIGESIDHGYVEDYYQFNEYDDSTKAVIRETLEIVKGNLINIVNNEEDFMSGVENEISSGCNEGIREENLPLISQTKGVIDNLFNNLKGLEDGASSMKTPSADVPQLPELSLPSQSEEPNSSHGEPDSSHSTLSNDLQTVIGIVDQVLGDSDLSISEKHAMMANIQTKVEAAGNLLVDTQSRLGRLNENSILTDDYSINNKFREIIRQAIQNAFEKTLSYFITNIKNTDWESVFNAFPYQIGSYQYELTSFMNFDSVSNYVADSVPWIDNQNISDAITRMRGLADEIRSKLDEISGQLGMFQGALERELAILYEIGQIQGRLRNMQYRLQELQDNGQQQQTQENQDTSHE